MIRTRPALGTVQTRAASCPASGCWSPTPTKGVPRGVVLLLPPLFGPGIVDQIDEAAALEVLVPPTVPALLLAELLRRDVFLAVGIGDRRVEGGGVPTNAAVHVHQEGQLVPSRHVHAEIEGRRDCGVGNVLPTFGRPTCLPLSVILALIPSPGNEGPADGKGS